MFVYIEKFVYTNLHICVFIYVCWYVYTIILVSIYIHTLFPHLCVCLYAYLSDIPTLANMESSWLFTRHLIYVYH
jgi:hypothetical protein